MLYSSMCTYPTITNMSPFLGNTRGLRCFSSISFHMPSCDKKARFPSTDNKNIPVKHKCRWVKTSARSKRKKRQSDVKADAFGLAGDRSTVAATWRDRVIGQQDASRGAVKVTTEQRASIRDPVPLVLPLLRPCL